MDALAIEPTCWVVLGDVNRFRIMVVDTGGDAKFDGQPGGSHDAAQVTAVFVLQRQILYMGTVFTLDPPTAWSHLVREYRK